MRISDWSSDVCSSDLAQIAKQELAEIVRARLLQIAGGNDLVGIHIGSRNGQHRGVEVGEWLHVSAPGWKLPHVDQMSCDGFGGCHCRTHKVGACPRTLAPDEVAVRGRSEEHTSELPSLMRTSSA